MAAINILLTPTGSAVQFILASLPLLALIAYFVYLAHERPLEPCYTQVLDDDQAKEACHLIPLIDMIFYCLGCGLCWFMVGCYLSIYLPKRRALIEEYLDSGKTIIGNVHYKPDRNEGCCRLANYGYAVYPHPNYKKLPVFIRRQVRVFERYTRERITLLFLKGKSFSAQPQEELETDREIFRRNEGRMSAITCFAWSCVAFCYLSSVYILKIIYDLDVAGVYEFQPDYNGTKAFLIFSLVGGVFNPVASFAVGWIAWSRHEKWMTQDHKILEEVDDDESWYEGSDVERANYEPPVPE